MEVMNTHVFLIIELHVSAIYILGASYFNHIFIEEMLFKWWASVCPFPTLHSTMSYWYFTTESGGRIYTTEIRKCYIQIGSFCVCVLWIVQSLKSERENFPKLD